MCLRSTRMLALVLLHAVAAKEVLNLRSSNISEHVGETDMILLKFYAPVSARALRAAPSL